MEFLVALGIMDGALKHMDSVVGEQYACLVAEGLLAGAIFWCIGISSDRNKFAMKAQVLLMLTTGALLCYSQTIFEDTPLPGNPNVTQRTAAVLAATAVGLWAVGEKRREFRIPVCEETELGQDFECTEMMELKQLALAGDKLIAFAKKDQ